MGQGKWDMKIFTLAVFSFALAFAGEKYGVYDSQGSRISTFEAERHELLEKTRQAKNGYPNKAVYVSSLQKGKGSKPSSQYHFKTGSYIEAARKETFAICPPDKKTEGIWISEYSVALGKENCLSVQTPDLAGTIDVLFMEVSGKTDTIQVLVDQSYIQMGDYSHKIWVQNERVQYPSAPILFIAGDGKYESRSYNWNLIVDKTKFILADAWRYPIDSFVNWDIDWYINNNTQLRKHDVADLKKFRIPLPINDYAKIRFANMRSKMEGLDTVYVWLPMKDAQKFMTEYGKPLSEMREHWSYKYKSDSDTVVVLDTSSSGYRVPFEEEWMFLMRAGASTRYYWGDEEDSLTVSRYARWCSGQAVSEKTVAQLIPNQFGLYDMMGLAGEECFPYTAAECRFLKRGMGCGKGTFRLLRKTPKLHKLEKL
jgi:hypothetical protein